MTPRLAASGAATSPHDLTATVRKGEILAFRVKAEADPKVAIRRVQWDPVVTYVEAK
jgi:Holliday junction resolvase